MNGLSLQIEIPRGTRVVTARVELPDPGIVSIFGPSGAGKTTVLRAIAGLEPGARGVIRIGGDTVLDSAAGIDVPAHRRRVGYVFQEASLLPHLDVRGNLRYARRRAARHARNAGWDAVVEILGVETLLDRRVTHLSGGERQRVAIAQAVLSCPRLLLMDEPLANLDEASRGVILPYITLLHREFALPVVYVSHVVREVAQIADFIVELREGAVRASGPAQEMLHRIATQARADEEPLTTLRVEVVERNDRYHLVRGQTAFGPIWIPAGPAGAPAAGRVQIDARDVSLGLARERDTSIMNEFAVVIVDLAERARGQTLVRLAPETAPGGPFLLALITTFSRDRLALAPGMRLFARVKSVRTLA